MARNLNVLAHVVARSMSYDKPLHFWLDDGRELEGVPSHMLRDENIKHTQTRSNPNLSNVIVVVDGEHFHLMRVQRARWAEGPPPAPSSRRD